MRAPGRGGRAVDCAGLENRKAERPREFESHPLRHLAFNVSAEAGFQSKTGQPSMELLWAGGNDYFVKYATDR